MAHARMSHSYEEALTELHKLSIAAAAYLGNIEKNL